MNRRDFIKYMSVSAAATAASSTLAKLPETKEKIGDIIVPEKEIIVEKHELIIEERVIIPVLAYNMDQARHWMVDYFEKKFFDKPFRYVQRREDLLGIERGINILGLPDYWLRSNIGEIMEEVYVRGMTIRRADYF